MSSNDPDNTIVLDTSAPYNTQIGLPAKGRVMLTAGYTYELQASICCCLNSKKMASFYIRDATNDK